MTTDSQARRIYVVEDEAKLASLLEDYLRREGFEVRTFERGDTALAAIREQPPDLVVLDLMLPGLDGLGVCREVRRFSDLPIIMVTARVEEIDRLLGLELGADDYVCKPFSPREVVARVKTVLRRLDRTPSAPDAEVGAGVQEPGAAIGARGNRLHIDPERFVASFDGRRLDLTPVEFRLLRALGEQPGRVFSRDQLLGHMYADHRLVSDRTIDSHIKNLRRKLDEVSGGIPLIHSIYGVGYKLELERSDASDNRLQ